MRRYLIALMMLVVSLRAVPAQAAVADSGARIRITRATDSHEENGTLVSLTPNTLVYYPGFLTTLNRTPLDSVRTIEKSQGVRLNAHNIVVGAGIGGLVGFGAAAALLALPSHGDGPSSVVGFVAFAPIFTAVGIVAGGLLGSEHQTEEWSQLYPDVSNASMIVGPAGHGGLAFGWSLPYDVPGSIDDAPSDSAIKNVEP